MEIDGAILLSSFSTEDFMTSKINYLIWQFWVSSINIKSC